jgi:hypothetical protein
MFVCLFFANKVLLEHSHAHSLTWCLALCCISMAELSSWDKDLMSQKALNILPFREACPPQAGKAALLAVRLCGRSVGKERGGCSCLHPDCVESWGGASGAGPMMQTRMCTPLRLLNSDAEGRKRALVSLNGTECSCRCSGCFGVRPVLKTCYGCVTWGRLGSLLQASIHSLAEREVS